MRRELYFVLLTPTDQVTAHLGHVAKMKYHELFFVTNPANSLDASVNIVNSLVQGLENKYPSATRQAPWSLQYRAFRDTIPPGASATDAEGKPKPFPHTFQHLLHLSSLDQNNTYICIQSPNGKSTVTGIPLRQQEAHAFLVRNQFAALWQLRHMLSLPQGTTYSTNLCTVQIGELRAAREGPQSGGIPSPGVIVCISTSIGSEEESDDSLPNSLQNGTGHTEEDTPDFEYAHSVIQACWSAIKSNLDLGRSEIREAMMAKENVNGIREKEAVIRMWSEILRLRG